MEQKNIEPLDYDQREILKTVEGYFMGTDFELVIETLSHATYHHLFTILKDYGADDNEGIYLAASETLHLTDVMSLLSKLYYYLSKHKEQSKKD